MRRVVAWRLLAAVGVAGVVPVLAAAPAHAELNGPCTAQGVIDGVNYDPKVQDEVDELPAEADVVWDASVTSPNAPEERAVSGQIVVDLPGGIGEVEVGSWGDESDDYENNDTYHYDLPSVVEGIPITVSGSHTENGVECSGSITVTIGEGGFGNPAAIPALVITALSAVVLVVAIRAGG